MSWLRAAESQESMEWALCMIEEIWYLEDRVIPPYVIGLEDGRSEYFMLDIKLGVIYWIGYPDDM